MDDEKKELTAKYICEHPDWLEIALDVYEAMPTVRRRLIGTIWKGVEKRVRKQLDDRVDVYHYPDRYDGFYFSPKGLKLMICAETTQIPGTKPIKWGPTCSVWVEEGFELADARRKEIIGIFEKVTDDQMRDRGVKVGHRWSYPDSDYLAFVNVGGEYWDATVDYWDDGGFLRRAVQSQNEIVSNLADLLVGIYGRIEGDIERIA